MPEKRNKAAAFCSTGDIQKSRVSRNVQSNQACHFQSAILTLSFWTSDTLKGPVFIYWDQTELVGDSETSAVADKRPQNAAVLQSQLPLLPLFAGTDYT